MNRDHVFRSALDQIYNKKPHQISDSVPHVAPNGSLIVDMRCSPSLKRPLEAFLDSRGGEGSPNHESANELFTR